ncbi:MAG: DUF1707 SHOCT-like domain-containing protein [Nocardioidaceae bacterium]
MSPRPEIRLGDAEREAAVSALGEHYAAGRLTKDEYDERADRAWAARYGTDLAPLFVDLPALQAPVDRRHPTDPASRRPRGRLPFLPVLLVVLGIAMLAHVPWPFLLLFGWLLWRGLLWRWVGPRRWAGGAQSRGRDRVPRGRWA